MGSDYQLVTTSTKYWSYIYILIEEYSSSGQIDACLCSYVLIIK